MTKSVNLEDMHNIINKKPLIFSKINTNNFHPKLIDNPDYRKTNRLHVNSITRLVFDHLNKINGEIENFMNDHLVKYKKIIKAAKTAKIAKTNKTNKTYISNISNISGFISPNKYISRISQNSFRKNNKTNKSRMSKLSGSYSPEYRLRLSISNEINDKDHNNKTHNISSSCSDSVEEVLGECEGKGNKETTLIKISNNISPMISNKKDVQRSHSNKSSKRKTIIIDPLKLLTLDSNFENEYKITKRIKTLDKQITKLKNETSKNLNNHKNTNIIVNPITNAETNPNISIRKKNIKINKNERRLFNLSLDKELKKFKNILNDKENNKDHKLKQAKNHNNSTTVTNTENNIDNNNAENISFMKYKPSLIKDRFDVVHQFPFKTFLNPKIVKINKKLNMSYNTVFKEIVHEQDTLFNKTISLFGKRYKDNKENKESKDNENKERSKESKERSKESNENKENKVRGYFIKENENVYRGYTQGNTSLNKTNINTNSFNNDMYQQIQKDNKTKNISIDITNNKVNTDTSNNYYNECLTDLNQVNINEYKNSKILNDLDNEDMLFKSKIDKVKVKNQNTYINVSNNTNSYTCNYNAENSYSNKNNVNNELLINKVQLDNQRNISTTLKSIRNRNLRNIRLNNQRQLISNKLNTQKSVDIKNINAYSKLIDNGKEVLNNNTLKVESRNNELINNKNNNMLLISTYTNNTYQTNKTDQTNKTGQTNKTSQLSQISQINQTNHPSTKVNNTDNLLNITQNNTLNPIQNTFNLAHEKKNYRRVLLKSCDFLNNKMNKIELALLCKTDIKDRQLKKIRIKEQKDNLTALKVEKDNNTITYVGNNLQNNIRKIGVYIEEPEYNRPQFINKFEIKHKIEETYCKRDRKKIEKIFYDYVSISEKKKCYSTAKNVELISDSNFKAKKLALNTIYQKNKIYIGMKTFENNMKYGKYIE